MRDRGLPVADLPWPRLPAEAVGQKAYNGVAVLARVPFTVVHRALPGLPEDDAQARYIEVEADGITLIGIYLPNGNSRGDEGFAYKLAWMDRLADRAQTLLEPTRRWSSPATSTSARPTKTIAPGALSPTDALVRPETRARYRRLIWMGLTDAVRAMHPHGAVYTFWDYQAGAWQRDLRPAHRPCAAVAHPGRAPDRGRTRTGEERAQPQPSDHVPVMIELR